MKYRMHPSSDESPRLLQKDNQKAYAFLLKQYSPGEVFHLLWNYWLSWWWLCCICIPTHKYVPSCTCAIYKHMQEVSRNCFCAELSVSQLCHFWRSLCFRGEWYGVTLSPWKLSVIFLYFTVLPNSKIIAQIFLDSSSNATSSQNWAQNITATGKLFFFLILRIEDSRMYYIVLWCAVVQCLHPTVVWDINH